MKTTNRFVAVGIALVAVAMVLLLVKSYRRAGRVHNRAHGLRSAGKRANGTPQRRHPAQIGCGSHLAQRDGQA